VNRLRGSGVIQREIAILDHSNLGPTLTAIIEVSLDRQTAEDHQRFESYICAEPAVTQCYRVSPGPDLRPGRDSRISEASDINDYPHPEIR